MSLSDASLQELSQTLDHIASPVRLQILRQLRDPQRVSAIRVTAGLSRRGERPERPLARQTVTHHLERLMEAGLVRTSSTGGDKRGDAYILNYERLFALTDELRQLNNLRPFVRATHDPGDTLTAPKPGVAPLPDPPRLLEAYGARDGRAFQLPARGRAVLGRDRDSDIHVDHDPYVSGTHCAVEQGEARWTVTDLGSSNGTWVNWDPAPAKQAVELRPGDLLRVGRTHLVFQA